MCRMGLPKPNLGGPSAPVKPFKVATLSPVRPMTDTLRVRPADIIIDEQNPRLVQPNLGQRETLRGVWANEPDKLLTLAKDIVEVGGLDPTNRLIVMPFDDNGRVCYRVLEGNRRVAAIKALESPDVLVDAIAPSALKALRKLAQDFQKNPIAEIDCGVVEKREDADHWIMLRHTGESGGRGIVPWGADEKDRYLLRTGKVSKAPLHSQVLSFLQARGDLSEADRRKVPVATLERMTDDPDIRAKMGIESIDGILHLRASADQVAKACIYVVRGLIDKEIQTKDVYTKDDRKTFAAEMPAKVTVKATKPAGQGTPAPQAATSTAPPKPKKAKKSPAKRDKLIPTDCHIGSTDRVKEIEGELRRLSLEHYPNAVSVLLRVFVELTVDHYVKANKMKGFDEDSKLSFKMQKVTEALKDGGKLDKQQAKAMSRCISADSALAPSILLMHGYVHNPNMHVSPQDLRASWDNLQAFVVACWSP